MNTSSDSGRGLRPVPIDRLVRPFQIFARHKLAGAILLMGCTVLAIAWANSPWAHHYHDILQAEGTIRIGAFEITKSIHHWINDGLMGLFFFLVGMEIKREILAGDLSSPKKAMLPIFAALGGMVVPGALYAILNHAGPGHRGWGVPMATDIAFALGVLALLGSRVPTGLKVFLTALAIVDDIGAILVIAIFYTDSIYVPSLILGGCLFLVAIIANRWGVVNSLFFYLLGTLMWLSFLKSGVHATLAAVLIAMAIPARARLHTEPFRLRMENLLDAWKSREGESGVVATKDQQNLLHEMESTVDQETAPLQSIEHALLPLVTFIVLPVFAAANAGVTLGEGFLGQFGEPVCLGIILGLFLGKQAGIWGFSFLAVKLRLAQLPAGVNWRLVHGVSILGGIGFTMSLFVNELAFRSPERIQVGKVGVLAASLLSALIGWGLLRFVYSRK